MPQDRFFAVEKFGSFDKILEPGLNCAGIDMCGMCVSFRSISQRVEQNMCLVETKTKDNVFVLVSVAVQLSVMAHKADAAMYKLSNVPAQIDSYVSDVVRSQLPRMSLDEAFEKKDAVSDAIQRELGSHMTEYGFTIHKALVTEIKPNKEVRDSMNEINKQKRLRDAAIMQAEAEKIKKVTAAQAEADAARLQGEGIARQRTAIVEGLRASISSGSGEQLTSEKISELLLVSQYFDTLRQIGANDSAQAIFLPHGEGSTDMCEKIRNGILQGQAASPKQVAMN